MKLGKGSIHKMFLPFTRDGVGTGLPPDAVKTPIDQILVSLLKLSL